MNHRQTEFEKKSQVVSFITEKGSVYTYDSNRKTTRYKTTTGETEKPSDITVFVSLSLEEERRISDITYQNNTADKSLRVYIFEKNNDGTADMVESRDDVIDPNKLYLAIYNMGSKQIYWTKKASLEPVIGCDVYDIQFSEAGGRKIGKGHLGNRVIKINY